MKTHVWIGFGLAVLLAACSSSPERSSRQNDPNSKLSASDVFVQKGVKYMEAGNYDVALRDMQHGIALDKNNSEAYNAIAVLYQRLEDPAKAEANFQKALALKSDNFGARNNYGRLLCSRGKHAEGMEQFQKVIGSKLYDQPWIPLTNAGVCASAAGQKMDAEHYLRDALTANPGFPPALLEMAKLSQETRQHMSARAFLQRYHEVANPNPESLSLGIDIELSLGNSDAARKYAQVLQSRFSGTKEAVQARRRLSPE